MNYDIPHKFPHIRLFHLLVAGILLLPAIACSQFTPPAASPSPTPTESPTIELVASPTATPSPIGSEQNPIILAVVATDPNTAQDRLQAGIEIAARLTDSTGLTVHAETFVDYPALMQALQQNRAHITFLPPLTYLYARERDLVEVALLSNHFGVFLYGTQFLANQASGFKTYIDPETGQNTAGADEALQQFFGKRPCWTESGSASGYIYPIGLLKTNNVGVEDAALLQTHAGVIRALYVQGICDFGATYAVMGDPRTSSAVSDLPAVLDQIQIIWRSDPIIPNLNVSFTPSLPADLRQSLAGSLMELAQTDDGRSALSRANDYDIKDLQAYPDSVYEPLREAVNQSGTALINTLGK